MAISIPSEVRKDLIRATVKGSSAHKLISLLLRRTRPVPTPEVRNAVGVINISDAAKKANKRLKSHGLVVQCVKTGSGRSDYGWIVGTV
jgi:hypothetical protein